MARGGGAANAVTGTAVAGGVRGLRERQPRGGSGDQQGLAPAVGSDLWHPSDGDHAATGRSCPARRSGGRTLRSSIPSPSSCADSGRVRGVHVHHVHVVHVHVGRWCRRTPSTTSMVPPSRARMDEPPSGALSHDSSPWSEAVQRVVDESVRIRVRDGAGVLEPALRERETKSSRAMRGSMSGAGRPCPGRTAAASRRAGADEAGHELDAECLVHDALRGQGARGDLERGVLEFVDGGAQDQLGRPRDRRCPG